MSLIVGILCNKFYKRHFRHEFYVRHERSECLINECLEKFIKNVLHTILFLRPNKQMKQATFLLNVNLIV
jgi:hypothetical protein